MIVVSPPGERKMSEVLLEFLEPYSKHWATEEQFKKLVTVGLVAWNAALMSGRARDDFIEKMAKAVPPELRPEMREIVDEMVRRKEAHFANIRRTIVSFDVTMTPSGPHLSVLSTLNPL
jgi:hypothetical protein